LYGGGEDGRAVEGKGGGCGGGNERYTKMPAAISLAMRMRRMRGIFVFFFTRKSKRDPLGQYSVTRLKYNLCPTLLGLVIAPTKLMTFG